jgi:hypothetical protein
MQCGATAACLPARKRRRTVTMGIYVDQGIATRDMPPMFAIMTPAMHT